MNLTWEDVRFINKLLKSKVNTRQTDGWCLWAINNYDPDRHKTVFDFVFDYMDTARETSTAEDALSSALAATGKDFCDDKYNQLYRRVGLDPFEMASEDYEEWEILFTLAGFGDTK